MSQKEKQLSYNEWIQSVQTDRNAEWNYNVQFSPSPDTPTPPPFAPNTLFHNNTVEDYAMTQTTLASGNIQTAARITRDQNLFAPCMVGTLESQFLKMMAKMHSHPRFILDVGTFTGMSAIALAEGALANENIADGNLVQVHTLEFDGPTAQAAQTIFDACEDKVKKAIHLHHCDAVQWMRDAASDPNGPTFDIIFIDADKDNYVAYYKLAMGDDDGQSSRALLAKGGMILADNTLSALVYDEDDSRRVALHEFNQLVKNDERVEQVVMTVREGVTLITRV